MFYERDNPLILDVTLDKDDILINVTTFFEKGTVKISSYETGCTCYFLSDSSDNNCFYRVDALQVNILNNDVRRKYLNVEQFLKRIPEKLIHSIEKFNVHQLQMIQLAARYKVVYELAISNPILLWLYVDKNKKWFRQGITRSEKLKINSDLGMKQHQILFETLNSHKNHIRNAHVKFIRKIKFLNDGDGRELSLIKNVLRSYKDCWSYFRNYKNIPVFSLEVIELLDYMPINPMLLKEFDKPNINTDDFERFRCIKDKLIDIGLMSSVDELKRLSSCRTRKHLDVFEQKILFESDNEDNNIFFHEPPIPDLENEIIALIDQHSLIKESLELSNCVNSMSNLILKDDGRRFYLYQVLKPQRATLLLKYDGRLRGKGWKINELRTYHNQDVSNETLNFVSDWLMKENLK